MIKKLFCAFFLALLAASASATDYVVSDCAAGADPGCVVGSDGAAGTRAAPWRTLAKVVAQVGTAVAGDRFIFCKGAAWSNWHLSTIPTTSSFATMKANPIIFDWANTDNGGVCSTFSATAKPLFLNRTKKLDNVTDCVFSDNPNPCNTFEFSQISGTPADRGGIIVQNLEFRGNDTAPAQSGGVVRGRLSNITWNNNTIGHMSYSGLYCISSGSFSPTKFIDWTSNSLVSIGQFGFASFNNCDTQYIAYNWCDFCANAAVPAATGALYHPMYVTGCAWTMADTCATRGTVIRSNVFTNSCTNRTDINPTWSACAVIVGHDRIDGWIVENNYIFTAVGKSDPRNWCIQYEPGNGGGYVEYQKRLVLRGNQCINPGNTGIVVSACQFCVAETNLIIQLNVTDNYNALSQRVSDQLGQGALANLSNTFQANSIFIEGVTDTSAALRFNGGGTGHTVLNNLLMYGATGPGSFGYCYETDLAASAFTTWDYNLCYNAVRWSVTYANRAAWNTGRSPQEANSLSTNPLPVTTPSSANCATSGAPTCSMALQGGSPAKSAASTACATTTSACRLAIKGATRVTHDIGAY